VWLPWLLVGLPMGAWVDRARKRPLLVACDLTSATALASVPVAAWLGVLTLAQLVAVALVAGTVAVCFGTAYHAYIPVVLDGRDLLAGNARLQGAEAATQVAGPGAAGLLTQAFGAASGLLADAVTFLVSAACLTRIGVAADGDGVAGARPGAVRGRRVPGRRPCWLVLALSPVGRTRDLPRAREPARITPGA
jgi:hypothetical protein